MTIDEDNAGAPPADGWLVRHGTEAFGPYTEDQMRSFVLEGRIIAETGIRRADEADWQPASAHPRFEAIFAELATAGPPRPEQMQEQAPDMGGPAGVPVSLTTATGLPPGETATMAHVVYALFVINLFTGIVGLIGVIIAHVKRGDVRGTWLESHYQWQIRTFWIGMAGAIVGFLLAKFGIGLVILVIVSLWYVWRIVKGWTRLGSSRAIDNPTGWY